MKSDCTKHTNITDEDLRVVSQNRKHIVDYVNFVAKSECDGTVNVDKVTFYKDEDKYFCVAVEYNGTEKDEDFRSKLNTAYMLEALNGIPFDFVPFWKDKEKEQNLTIPNESIVLFDDANRKYIVTSEDGSWILRDDQEPEKDAVFDTFEVAYENKEFLEENLKMNFKVKEFRSSEKETNRENENYMEVDRE